MGPSIAKLGERGALVEGDMIRLAALDLVLWIVQARVVGIAFDLELASMHAGDRAADAPASEFQLTRSWILKLFGTVVGSDAAAELQRRQFSH